LVIFSDEADLMPVYQFREYVRLREDQKLVDVVPLSEHRQKLVTIKVWGTISCFGVGLLIRFEGTMDSKKYL